ncbi:aminoglycoside phosphotransferase family protein [Spirillospora sp. NPDC047418]
MYNTTYRVALARHERPVILRVAPEPSRQFSSERELMRNEYASVPYLAAIAPLMPSVIAADWSHSLTGRDYMVQTFLDGIPAREHLGTYPRSAWSGFYRQLGTIARTIHAVTGPRFGPVAGPGFATWSEAITTSLKEIAADLEGIGLDATDIRLGAALAAENAPVLDEITEPRMLSGDLWTVNVMLDSAAPVPEITGVFDLDRTWWGDPEADWTIRMAQAKSDERTAFWDAYGAPDCSVSAEWRARIYEIRHLGGIRLERYRLGNTDGVRESYDAVAAIVGGLKE